MKKETVCYGKRSERVRSCKCRTNRVRLFPSFLHHWAIAQCAESSLAAKFGQGIEFTMNSPVM